MKKSELKQIIKEEILVLLEKDVNVGLTATRKDNPKQESTTTKYRADNKKKAEVVAPAGKIKESIIKVIREEIYSLLNEEDVNKGLTATRKDNPWTGKYHN